MAQYLVDEFVLNHVMNRVEDSNGDIWYWWGVVMDGTESAYEGYVVYWPDGNHHHTYRYPPDYMEE